MKDYRQQEIDCEPVYRKITFSDARKKRIAEALAAANTTASRTRLGGAKG